MKTLPIEASNEEVLHAIREWVNLLVEEQYQAAYDFLYHPSAYELTPDDIRHIITTYNQEQLGEAVSKVTPLETATGKWAPRHDVNRDPGETEGFILFDLPLNGEWSDLTATFDIVVHDDMLVIQLENIHVL